MPHQPLTQQMLNKAMLEAVDFVHAEGWDGPPTLFGLVPADVLEEQWGASISGEDDSPLTLVVQDLPGHLRPGSGELADYLSRVTWPPQVVGAVLAQEIVFRDTATSDAAPRPARLFSGVLHTGEELTLLQLRPSPEDLERAGLFAEDQVELRGGPGVAPDVIAALAYGFDSERGEGAVN
ncbi:PPA1309 family protein [Corynebacterium uberis]|uniref:PPA1309 family protein n=1 Tax=Corynebacterium TaxID=1716 RepID=UPI001D0B6DD9|nr:MULTISPECIES: PPA1309 family protein [Corynebacterium]MCZ9309199.1 PPA1309 family protein [Corynebacterium sp. c6VSa_13]UDL72758.1 hypothetical protein LH391_06440 [Corynebacterium uberis]UDL76365.1 hypothetical protein LH393_02960 [Corynebacterium uberis]UDL78577.1 hypothetical protein LH394_02945 [Corynebacterium uberis]UDL80858.1 hypothetical protein LH392_03375 [Corynebacterium uberis]